MGNQMFMYASAFAFSKKMSRDFLIDDETAFLTRKNLSQYRLGEFNFSARRAPKSLKFLGYRGYLKRKFLKKMDTFRKAKKFYIEKKSKDKITTFDDNFLSREYGENLFIEGYFESEKYFYQFQKEIQQEFTFKNLKIFLNNPYYKEIRDSNSVSICIRQNRFSEKLRRIKNSDIIKSKIFTDEQIKYVKKCIEIMKSKIRKPKFFLWSNDYKGLYEYFPKNEFTFVDNDKFISKDKKSALDLFLMTQAKNHIVIPSSFNWWGSWLSMSRGKIVLRPSDKNFTNFRINNRDLWPESWIEI